MANDLGGQAVPATSMSTANPWIAAALSLTGSPVGQIYAGWFRRAIVLWLVGVALLRPLALSCLSLPIGRTASLTLIGSMLIVPLVFAVDAFFVARRKRAGLSRIHQQWWVIVAAFLFFAVANQLLAIASRNFLVEAFQISHRSMSPTIQAGERILVDKCFWRPENLRRGQIIVFRSEGPGSPLFVMRVVGLPGDQVQIVDEKVLIDGVARSDAHEFFDPMLPADPNLAAFGPIEVPAETVFVLGDNRRLSRDSRFLGPIPYADVHGVARVIYWSRERQFPEPWNSAVYESGPIMWSRIGRRLD